MDFPSCMFYFLMETLKQHKTTQKTGEEREVTGRRKKIKEREGGGNGGRPEKLS